MRSVENSPEITEPLLVPIEVARRLLGIGRTKTYELIAAGELIARKLGAKTLIEVESIRRCAASLPTVKSRPVSADGASP